MRTLLILALMVLSMGCSSRMRISSYEMIRKRCQITNILQSDWAVMDAKDISAMAEKEFQLRIDRVKSEIDWLKSITYNGLRKIPSNRINETRIRRIEMIKCMEECSRIAQSGLLPTEGAEKLMDQMNSILNDPIANKIISMLPAL